MTASPSDPAGEALALVERLAEEMARLWRRGERPRAEAYLALHPELAERPEAALELIAEELYLRQEVGLEIEPADFTRRFPHWREQVRALVDCHLLMAPQFAAPHFPAAGETLGDFHLLAELGRGAHGRVFLATQPLLAHRPVVLKLAPRAGREHLSLSRLQHTSIVPLYSVHDFPERGLRALCQPYFGGTTLSALLCAVEAVPADRRAGRDLLRALERSGDVAPAALAVQGPACQFLARASYVEAVCRMGACLADALQYAHERELIHLDLKPSNVLLAADGQPMLLDFHLARAPLTAGAPAPAGLGGTPGYMPPEHTAAVNAVVERRDVPATVDGRADVYALGVLLYEALGGAVPAPAERPGEQLRRRNSRVTAGLADLLVRCLAADPVDRYPSAGDLAADLRRYLVDLPLRGVANRSPTERWRKWRRRRPLTLPLLGLLLAGAVACGALLTHVGRQARAAEASLGKGEDHLRRRHYAEAEEAFRSGAALVDDLPFHADLARQLRDGARQAERARAAGELHALCEQVRPLYGADFLPEGKARAAAAHCRDLWQQREQIAVKLGRLPTPELDRQVRTDLLDLAILGSNLRVRLASPSDVVAARREALDVLAQAEALFGPSRVLYEERRAHALALGLTDEAETAARAGAARAPRDAWEHYALGRAYLQAGDLARAAEHLDRALEQEPQALWPHFTRGLCAFRAEDFEDALLAFTACVVLAPESASCFYNRGRVFAELRRFDRARRDCEHALRLDPEHEPARRLLSQLPPR